MRSIEATGHYSEPHKIHYEKSDDAHCMELEEVRQCHVPLPAGGWMLMPTGGSTARDASGSGALSRGFHRASDTFFRPHVLWMSGYVRQQGQCAPQQRLTHRGQVVPCVIIVNVKLWTNA